MVLTVLGVLAFGLLSPSYTANVTGLHRDRIVLAATAPDTAKYRTAQAAAADPALGPMAAADAADALGIMAAGGGENHFLALHKVLHAWRHSSLPRFFSRCERYSLCT